MAYLACWLLVLPLTVLPTPSVQLLFRSLKPPLVWLQHNDSLPYLREVKKLKNRLVSLWNYLGGTLKKPPRYWQHVLLLRLTMNESTPLKLTLLLKGLLRCRQCNL